MQMKILHTSDLHIKEYEDKKWQTLKLLVKIAKEEGVKIFIISGDLFHQEVSGKEVYDKLREVFKGINFTTIILPGNHDKEVYKEGQFYGEGVKIIKNYQKPITLDNVNIWGLPFEDIPKEKVFHRLCEIEELKKRTPLKINILVYHGELLDLSFSKEECGEEGVREYMPVKLSYFKELNFKYVLAGHSHSRFVVKKIKEESFFIYPGSPISITKNEKGRRRVNLFVVGEMPKEYWLDTHHFDTKIIQLTPEMDDPVREIKKEINSLHPNGEYEVVIKGFINGEVITEEKLEEEIRKIEKNQKIVVRSEFKDIQEVINDEIYQRFKQKLEEKELQEEKEELLNMLTLAMMKVLGR
jgi:DNA repair exonuclease SbcCD nuclease subunit